MSYLRQFSTLATPQSEPLPGQVPNSAGGHAWPVDDWTRLDRFLVLGSEGGSYYASERALTRENAQAVMSCIAADGKRAVERIVEISRAGRAPKNDPAIFALALACSAESAETRALALDAIPHVCRIGTHLFTFAGYVENFRGWGRGLRTAIGRWYEREDLAYQLIKYRQRNGWTHRDLLRLAKPTPARGSMADALLGWAVGKPHDSLPEMINVFERAQATASARETAKLIRENAWLPREALNPDHLTSPEVWQAMLDGGMPLTALLRNLATMTRVGVIGPMSAGARQAAEQLVDAERLRKARVHPLAVLVALFTYAQGHGGRGSNVWQPVREIVDALDEAFYLAFDNVEPTGKRTLLALDVSGSMGGPAIAGMPGISPRIGSAAMALVTARVEPSYHVMAFTHEFLRLDISPRQRLDDVMRVTNRLAFGGTDCSLPMLWAQEAGVPVDTFVVYTDSETWFGWIHPAQALQRYREATGIRAKLVVVGMVSNGFSIADPSDAGMLDVVGFDTAAPAVIADFSAA